jgi:capsular polysaccharide biosynthesis protein
MRESGSDALAVLRWGLRRYVLLFVACLLLGAVAAPYAASKLVSPPTAEALVLATRVDMSLTALPRYAQDTFNDGRVAQAVATKFGHGLSVEDVIPGKVSLVADQDSIIFHVVGTDPDPKRAADIANVAADAFAAALNTGGVGTGAFTVQSPAEPPTAAAPGLAKSLAIPVGVVTGVVLGLAVVSLLLAVRRPVIDPPGVEDATGVLALGVVTVPRTRKGAFARPEKFPGLVPVCRRLLGLGLPTIVLVSRGREKRARMQISAVLVEVLQRVRTVRFTGPHLAPSAEEQRREALGSDHGRTDARDSSDSSDKPAPTTLTVIDGADPLELVQPPAETCAVLVARLGISSAALRAAVQEHLGGSAEARVLLVKRGRRTRGESPIQEPSTGTPEPEEAALAAKR